MLSDYTTSEWNILCKPILSLSVMF